MVSDSESKTLSQLKSKRKSLNANNTSTHEMLAINDNEKQINSDCIPSHTSHDKQSEQTGEESANNANQNATKSHFNEESTLANYRYIDSESQHSNEKEITTNVSLNNERPYDSEIITINNNRKEDAEEVTKDSARLTHRHSHNETSIAMSSHSNCDITVASLNNSDGSNNRSIPLNIDLQTQLSVVQDKPYHRFHMLKGISLSFASALFFSITAVIVKYVHDVHAAQMACFRFFGIMLFTFPLLLESGKHPFGPRNVRHWLILRGLAGATSLYFRYAALHYLPLADATVIALSTPVFVCIFARIFLKEPCGIFHVISLCITFIGIGFTSKFAVRLGLSNNEIVGLMFSLGAPIVASAAYVIVRKLKGVHHSVILFNFSWVAITETSIITYSLDGFKLPDCGIAPWMLTLLAVFSFYGQLLLTKALQQEEAGLVSVMRASSEVVFAFVFQIVIFAELPDLSSIIGATLVTATVILTSSRKYIAALPKGSRVRKALNFVTK